MRCHCRPYDFSSIPILIRTQMSIAEPHLYGWTPTFCPWHGESIPHRVSTADWDAVILCLVVGKADTRIKKRVTKRNRVVRFSWIYFVPCVTVTASIIMATDSQRRLGSGTASKGHYLQRLDLLQLLSSVTDLQCCSRSVWSPRPESPAPTRLMK